MTWMTYLLGLFGLGWALVGCFRSYAIKKGFLDKPNSRSSHHTPTARGGGVVFFVGWVMLAGVLYVTGNLSLAVIKCLCPVLLIGWVGYWEDVRGLSIWVRLIIQSLAAIAFLFIIRENGSLIAWLPLSYPYSLGVIALGIIWMTNLFNFMDGSDGMATQEAIFFFGMGGYFLFQQQGTEFGVLAWGLVALLAGFLTWNWPVARIFMGDSGSCFLGFTMSLYAIIAHKYFGIPLVIWFILTGLFWFDATTTLLRRIIHRENWRSPHRLHAYQRLIQHGWSHQSVLFCAMGANVVLSGLAWMAFKDPRLQEFAIGVTLSFLTCLYLMIEIIKPMYKAWYGRPT